MPLDKHYGDFGGLDVSTNLLQQSPKSCRDGSKNFRWNYKEQLQKREGFQHKSDSLATSPRPAALMEYVFTDVNNGNTEKQLLMLATDGYLYKVRKDFISFYNDGSGSLAKISIYYDEVALTHKIDFLDSSDVVIGSVSISLSMPLKVASPAINGLKGAIDALSITGLTVTVYDDEGTAYASDCTTKAYLIDALYRVDSTIATTVATDAFYFEKIKCADSDSSGSNDYGLIPFKNTQEKQVDSDYEGAFFVNDGNAIYISDGGFLYKYDQGGVLYRAGMPDLNRFSGWTIDNSSISGSLDSGKTYKYSFQLCFRDVTGSLVCGNTYLSDEVTGDNAYKFKISGLQNTSFETGFNPNKQFPIYSCCVDGDQVKTGSNFTFTVKSGHNIKSEMYLRFHEKPNDGSSPTGKVGFRYLKVSSVTSTTISVTGAIGDQIKQGDISDSSFIGSDSTLWDDLVINGCYLPTSAANSSSLIFTPLTEPYSSLWHPSRIYGAFLRIGRTLGDGSTFSMLYDAPIPHDKTWEYDFNDTLTDAVSTSTIGLITLSFYNGLSNLDADVDTSGKELPKAGKYLAKWQNQLVQAGEDRSFFNSWILLNPYPNFNSTGYKKTINGIDFSLYQENDVCDGSTIYWANSTFPEGFPQSGLNEEDFNYIYADKINGIFSNKEALFVFKDKTTGYLTGTLATGDLVKEFLEADVGCATQGTIQDISGKIIFMDENMGFWSVIAGRLPEFIGNPLIEYFKENSQNSSDYELKFKLARSTNFREKDLYVCFIQAGLRNKFNGIMSEQSVFFAFDHAAIGRSKRNCWYKWMGVNALGGLIVHSGKLLIASYGNYSALDGNNRIWAMKDTGSKYDFSDHISPVEFMYKGSFLTLGEPSVDKSWIRCVINSIQGGFDLIVQQFANFMDTSVSDYTVSFPSSGKNTVKMDVKASVPKLSGLSWGFYNNDLNSDVKIDGWEIEYNAPFDRSEPKK